MHKLIESTFVSLSGDIGGPQDWALQLSSEEQDNYARPALWREVTWNASSTSFGTGIVVLTYVPG
jgi:hypothetical protein